MLRIFVYGTLKSGFSNHALMRNPISHNDAAFIGTYRTLLAYHPVRDGVPYLIPGQGHRIRGELYTVTSAGLEPLDDLEGVAVAHYERLPIRVVGERGGVVLEAEAYFAHREFGEALWERKGRKGLSEYLEIEVVGRFLKRPNKPHERR